MNGVQRKVIALIIGDFTTTYDCFLMDHQIKDNPLSKAAFYAACEYMVAHDPFPNEEIQEAVLQELRYRKAQAVDNYVEKIEDALINIARIPVML